MRINLIFLLLLATCSLSLSQIPSHTIASPQLGQQTTATDVQSTAPVAAMVTAVEANLRDRPTVAGNVVTTVKKDDLLLLLSPNPVGPWYRVRDAAKQEVWIQGNNIALLYPGASSGTASIQQQQVSRPRTTASQPSSGRSYVNVDGVRVQSPTFSERRPADASARCNDGSYSFSLHRRGTCSHHGGVAEWY